MAKGIKNKQFKKLSDEELEQVSGGVTVKNEALARRAEITKVRLSDTILD